MKRRSFLETLAALAAAPLAMGKQAERAEQQAEEATIVTQTADGAYVDEEVGTVHKGVPADAERMTAELYVETFYDIPKCGETVTIDGKDWELTAVEAEFSNADAVLVRIEAYRSELETSRRETEH